MVLLEKLRHASRLVTANPRRNAGIGITDALLAPKKTESLKLGFGSVISTSGSGDLKKVPRITEPEFDEEA